MRTVIFHYHLFKNAGTSLDAIFKKNFGDKWVTKEFPPNPKANREAVAEWILNEKEAVCFSSHTANLPPPNIKGIKVIPVIFVRHPIDRIVSAYNFESKQADGGFGSVLAKNTTLSGYIETRLSLLHDRQCRNFHTHRFAAFISDPKKSELDRALGAIESLPIVGVVDEFDKSIAFLTELLRKEGFDAFSAVKGVELNVTRPVKEELLQRVDHIVSGLRADVYRKLAEANMDDMALYNRAKDILALYQLDP
ncbi:MAG: hypothetical protein CMF25_05215 [Kangiellaceae bacterium]|jgi:hypothetical protein|nr:hypothetical protein [Kangiellaceae bacterium]|tara:strand:+ start:6022 stop:6774 length:753 start_codon:yes stop_codon:yes gene_type:complete